MAPLSRLPVARQLPVSAFAVFFTLSAIAPAAPALDVHEIVARSVANNEANWKAAPQFAFRERDVVTRGGKRSTRTYEVLMIEGSPYNRLVSVNGKELDEAAKQREERKLRAEMERRRSETAAARRRRIAQYERERRQDHQLMREMVKAFDFRLAGKETVNGRECFRVEASPRPGYVPRSRETKVLTGMRGTMWIDAAAYQWVRVKAAVFRPVAFGLFIAHVQPGTEFILEEAPVEGNIWLPRHFETRVNAKVLLWSRNSLDDETYSDYHRTVAMR